MMRALFNCQICKRRRKSEQKRADKRARYGASREQKQKEAESKKKKMLIAANECQKSNGTRARKPTTGFIRSFRLVGRVVLEKAKREG